MASQQVLEYLREVSLGDHLILLYEDEETRSAVLSTYIRSGLAKGYAVCWGFMDERIEDMRELLLEHGVDPDSVHFVNTKDIHAQAREGRIDAIVEAIGKLCTDSIEREKKGVWLIGNLSFDLFKRGSIESALQIERTAGVRLRRPMSMLCPYDSRLFVSNRGVEHFPQFLRAHGHALFRGIALRLGPYEGNNAARPRES